jgi:hypothetical protein
MYRRVVFWLTMIILGGLLLPNTVVIAASDQPDDGVVIWNEDYILRENEELDGDLVVFNGDVTLEAGSRVTGDVIAWNGSAYVDAVIAGNLVTSNGSIQLDENAHVRGDVVCTWNCNIEQADDSRVDGEIFEGPALQWLPLADWSQPGLRIRIPPPQDEPPWVSGAQQLLRWMLWIVRSVVTTLIIAAIGGLVALIWPKATVQVERTVFQSPGASLGVGVLTIVAAVALIVALAITICLSPAAALVALAVGAAGLFGWVAIGARVGRRLLKAVDAGEIAPLWTGAVGTLIITLISVGLSGAFCLAPLGWLLIFVIGCFGLGAVVLTRFGTTPYVPDRQRESVVRPPTSPPQPTQVTVEDEDEAMETKDSEGEELNSYPDSEGESVV